MRRTYAPLRRRVSRYALLLCTIALVSATAAAAQPGFSKSFSPDTMGPGSVSTLTFTIDNSMSSLDATGLGLAALRRIAPS